MAQFRASIRGQRGEASRLGGKSYGIQAKINGWGLGVDVDGTYDKKTDCDSFTVTITGGSGRGKGALLIKEDRDTNGVLMGFTVSEKPAEIASGA